MIDRPVDKVVEVFNNPHNLTMLRRFSEAGQGKTRYEVDIDYKFSGVMMRLMGLTMGWMLKRQSYKSMERFKAFVESQLAGGFAKRGCVRT